MTKQELLAMDVLSLQKLIKDKTAIKERLDTQIEKGHLDLSEVRRKAQQPIATLESSLKLLRIEADSLIIQITARKDELAKLGQLHTTVLDDYGQKVANKEQTLLFIESNITTLETDLKEKENTLQKKQQLIVSLTKQITDLQFEFENYQKTIKVVADQLKEMMLEVKKNAAIIKKLETRVKELRRTHHVTVDDILTERNKRLWVRHKQRTGMNKALDVMIERKQKKLK
jgi:predicted  nucleic acid-binding Zn-ribbon protein